MCPSYSELRHLRWSTRLVVDGVEDVPRPDSRLLRRTVIEYVQKHPAFALLGFYGPNRCVDRVLREHLSGLRVVEPRVTRPQAGQRIADTLLEVEFVSMEQITCLFGQRGAPVVVVDSCDVDEVL
jgi:hypothetical protein